MAPNQNELRWQTRPCTFPEVRALCRKHHAALQQVLPALTDLDEQEIGPAADDFAVRGIFRCLFAEEIETASQMPTNDRLTRGPLATDLTPPQPMQCVKGFAFSTDLCDSILEELEDIHELNVSRCDAEPGAGVAGPDLLNQGASSNNSSVSSESLNGAQQSGTPSMASRSPIQSISGTDSSVDHVAQQTMLPKHVLVAASRLISWFDANSKTSVLPVANALLLLQLYVKVLERMETEELLDRIDTELNELIGDDPTSSSFGLLQPNNLGDVLVRDGQANVFTWIARIQTLSTKLLQKYFWAGNLYTKSGAEKNANGHELSLLRWCEKFGADAWGTPLLADPDGIPDASNSIIPKLAHQVEKNLRNFRRNPANMLSVNQMAGLERDHRLNSNLDLEGASGLLVNLLQVFTSKLLPAACSDFSKTGQRKALCGTFSPPLTEVLNNADFYNFLTSATLFWRSLKVENLQPSRMIGTSTNSTDFQIGPLGLRSLCLHHNFISSAAVQLLRERYRRLQLHIGNTSYFPVNEEFGKGFTAISASKSDPELDKSFFQSNQKTMLSALIDLLDLCCGFLHTARRALQQATAGVNYPMPPGKVMDVKQSDLDSEPQALSGSIDGSGDEAFDSVVRKAKRPDH